MLYFNSIKVRLEHSKTAGDILRNTLFQFHKGTIRTDFPSKSYHSQFLFQFHKGTIRTMREVDQNGMISYFNSIKVRLELKDVVQRLLADSAFQFHKGTIRTYLPNLCNDEDSNFNSIKVRLELKDVVQRLLADSAFQFHKGTIRTYLPNLCNDEDSNFNSIKVRLEQFYPSLPKASEQISIP